jgi:hypothetical protein
MRAVLWKRYRKPTPSPSKSSCNNWRSSFFTIMKSYTVSGSSWVVKPKLSLLGHCRGVCGGRIWLSSTILPLGWMQTLSFAAGWSSYTVTKHSLVVPELNVRSWKRNRSVIVPVLIHYVTVCYSKLWCFCVLIPFSLVDSYQRLRLQDRTSTQQIKVRILIAFKTSLSHMPTQLKNTKLIWYLPKWWRGYINLQTQIFEINRLRRISKFWSCSQWPCGPR